MRARIATILVMLMPIPSGADRLPAEIADDAVLARLPAVARGWRIVLEGDRLIFERKEPVWVIFQNRINAPGSTETPDQTANRIKKHGQRVNPRFSFRLEPRWTTARRERAQQENVALGRQIAALGTKHGIQALIDQVARSKNPDPGRLARTPEEQHAVRAYRAERAALEARRVKLPDYTSQRHSLFFVGHEGWSDAFHLVYPSKASEECYRVERTVREALEH